MVWFVVTVRTMAKAPGDLADVRTVGYYHDRDNALLDIWQNSGDIYEAGYYPYALIEGVPEGLYPDPEKIQETWFQWKGDEDSGGYMECSKPEALKDTVCFAVG